MLNGSDSSAEGLLKFKNMNVSQSRINDVSADTNDYVNVTLENAPHVINHSGGLKYIASIITAVGRSLINKSIDDGLKGNVNICGVNDPRVYYCDTDSVIVNEVALKNI